MTEADRVAKDILGIDTFTDVSGAKASDVITAFTNLITPQSGMTLRGALDEMSPACHRQLLAELGAIKTRILAIEAV